MKAPPTDLMQRQARRVAAFTDDLAEQLTTGMRSTPRLDALFAAEKASDEYRAALAKIGEGV